MPIYEYQCNTCDHKLEALQKISDVPLKDCPECGEAGLRKLVSAVAFRLKGSGWYETDFKGDKDKQKNLVKSDEKPADKDDKKADKPAGTEGGKSESKGTEAKSTETKSSDSKTTKTTEKKPSRTADD